jgi:hypothetical protein
MVDVGVRVQQSGGEERYIGSVGEVKIDGYRVEADRWVSGGGGYKVSSNMLQAE